MNDVSYSDDPRATRSREAILIAATQFRPA